MFFRFCQAKVLDCVFCARRSALRAVGWKKNHPRFAPVFFSAKPCHKKQPIQGTDACKIGKKHPDGIIHFKYLKNMKLQTIIRSVRLAAEGFLYLGIVLLCNKGIVPVCTIAFLLMAGNMTRLLAVIFLLAMIV